MLGAQCIMLKCMYSAKGAVTTAAQYAELAEQASFGNSGVTCCK